ncbi:SORTING NEXIN 4 [Hibiscus trionum]|uniref:SORTING NEXIN 4 n=1 Tax=Hibiscus trionum TaxID=183268 RepID=A0A9W7IX33_HIBTR|nr:SORTING NEXIN 4 [Hibiscus trionum]
MKPMETIQDLIDEAKLRTVWWLTAIFAVTYFMSHTSTSMWMNLPIAILIVSGLRILTDEVEFKWKVKAVRPQTYLSHLEKKQLSVNDSRLSSSPPPPKWKRKIDSPTVEAAINKFIDKILRDFVIGLWYSEITPDREFPELIRAVIFDAIGEISGRVKEINLVDLLTRDIVDLVGDHLDLFRRNQAAIGVDVMVTLSSEERDERLKHHLMVSEELHPALISPESEYKVIQRLIGGVLAVVLRPREAQCPLVRTIAREILTCLVMQPLLRLASPGYINEVIEYVLLAINTDTNKVVVGFDQSPVGVRGDDSTLRKNPSSNSQGTDLTLARIDDGKETYSDCNRYEEESAQSRPADWARILEAATQRRTEVLAPENLENMWTKGRYYKKKNKHVKSGFQDSIPKGSVTKSAVLTGNSESEVSTNKIATSTGREEKIVLRLMPGSTLDTQLCDNNTTGTKLGSEFNKSSSFEGDHLVKKYNDTSNQAADGNKNRLKRSSSTSDLKVKPDVKALTGDIGGSIISEFYSPDAGSRSEIYSGKIDSNIVLRNEGPHIPKLRCRVIGAYFEKLGSKPFAVYSIAVTDVENKTWFVKRRYSNFERLHRHLKEIPNYTLHLPPKTIFSSSTEDALVHQRCIQLDKYLQDLLSIANVAEQHEVWDFLSVSSKNYAFGKSSSVMRTLAVNVDDAMDDIVRQFRGVSDGLMRKVVGSSSFPSEASSSVADRTLSWNADEMAKDISRQSNLETMNSLSDNEVGDKDGGHGQDDRSGLQGHGWHSDDELNSKRLPPRVIKHGSEPSNSASEKQGLGVKPELLGQGGFPVVNFSATSSHLEDPVGMPPEWTPPNVSVPLLNLVDKVFQLKRRGWLRRQVFWMSKQILQLVMEDAIDDWLLRQIYWLRREDTVSQGIRWIQDVLWPGGTFFTRLGNIQSKFGDTRPDQTPAETSSQLRGSDVSKPGAFEQQLEATRRASDIKKMLFDGAPTTLVSLIGHKQYRRCARDIYYFTQSTICVKQLAFAILELVLISVFPEMRDVVKELHGKKQSKVP